MDSLFKTFFKYCNQQIALKNLSCSVFTPVMHYLVHIHDIINALGPLNVYSCRSNERAILKFKNLMTSTQSSQAQPSNLIAREATLSLFRHMVDIELEANIQRPAPYTSATWREHQHAENMPRQLWEPFKQVILPEDGNGGDIEGVSTTALRSAVNRFYARHFSEAGLRVRGDINIEFAGRAWLDYKYVVTSTNYAKMNRETQRAGCY